MQHVTLDDQISCVRRELAMRQHVYARQVSSGKMSQQESDREMAKMEGVLETLMSVAQLVSEVREEDSCGPS